MTDQAREALEALGLDPDELDPAAVEIVRRRFDPVQQEALAALEERIRAGEAVTGPEFQNQ